VSAKGLQQALARIYTDARVREEFFGGGAAALSDYELTPGELRQLQELKGKPRGRVEFFSTLLSNKQSKSVAALARLAFAALGEHEWGERWAAYDRVRPVEAVISPAATACGFLRFLKDSLPARLDGGLIRSIIGYEYGRLFVHAAAHAGLPREDSPRRMASGEPADSYPWIQRPFLVESFDYDLTMVIPALRLSKRLPRLEPDPTLILFYRNWRTGGASTAKISPMTSDLLRLCDGRTTAAGILRQLGGRAGGDAGVMLTALKRTLARLEEEGVLHAGSRPAGEKERGSA
jgi:hypothetical protein